MPDAQQKATTSTATTQPGLTARSGIDGCCRAGAGSWWQHSNAGAHPAPCIESRPLTRTDSVNLDLEVMNVLVAHVTALVDADESVNPGSTRLNEPLSDENAQWMGEFWYSVAAGEWVLNPQTV